MVIRSARKLTLTLKLEGGKALKIKISLKSGKEIMTPTSAPTMEAFMEELVKLISGTFGGRTRYVNKYGDFIDVNGYFIRYSEIDLIEEN
jgi:hypothetical protein